MKELRNVIELIFDDLKKWIRIRWKRFRRAWDRVPWIARHVTGWSLVIVLSAFGLADRSNPVEALTVDPFTWFVPIFLTLVSAVTLYFNARADHENLAQGMSAALLTWGVLVLAVMSILFLLQSLELTAIMTSGDPAQLAGAGKLQETMYRDGVDAIPVLKIPALFGWDDPVDRDGTAATVLGLGFASVLVKVGLLVGLLMPFADKFKNRLVPGQS